MKGAFGMCKKKTKRIFTAAVLAGMMVFGGVSGYGMTEAAVPASTVAQGSHMQRSSISELDNDSRVFKVDKSIDAKNVRFENRYGYEVAGHLYLPKNFDAKKKYKAVVITGPFGAVKEQSSGLYAQELAKNGFVAMAFDQSMTGESSGTRRNMASPDIFTEDYHAAVDFISNLDFVNPEQVGAMGICGLSGMAYHPRAINSDTLAWDSTAPYGFFDFSLMDNIDEISSHPVLLITGDKAHSKYFSDAVYTKLKAPKEEIVVPGATHVDLYDQMDKIPFDKLIAFFNKNLKFTDSPLPI